MQQHDDAYVEALATEYEGRPLQDAAYCAGCQQVRPLADFKRFMTKAEAKYRGYSGERLVQIETEKCKDCRPRRRRNPEAFTSAELKAKAEKGEINEGLVNIITKRRSAEALATQRAAAKKRWDVQIAGMWLAMIDDINRELVDVRQQRSYAKRRGDRPGVIAYVNDYCRILTKLRADLKVASRKATRKPEHHRWQDYLHHNERNIIAALWKDVEFKAKDAGMRPPQAFSRPDVDAHYRENRIGVYVPPVTPTTPAPTVSDSEEPTPTSDKWYEQL